LEKSDGLRRFSLVLVAWLRHSVYMSKTTYKLRGIEFGVNASGCLMECSDWESVHPRSIAGPSSKPHFGTNADLFKRGFGGRYFATQAFFALVRA
jgi:hypothetical protein